jgi:DNA polymerase-4
LAETLFRTGRDLLAIEADGTRFRLIGIGASGLGPAEEADQPNLIDVANAAQANGAQAKAERAMDSMRARFGTDAVFKGRAFGEGAAAEPDDKS